MENPREGIVSDHDADQMRSGNGESRPSAFHIEIADYAMSRGRADTVDMLRHPSMSSDDADQMRSGNGESRPSAFHIEISDYVRPATEDNKKRKSIPIEKKLLDASV